jgi:hypothetical protein
MTGSCVPRRRLFPAGRREIDYVRRHRAPPSLMTETSKLENLGAV